MRLHVDHAAAASALAEHLARQGFPARRVARAELDVLYPGNPALFAQAAELDLWCAEHAGVTVTVGAASSA